MKTNKMTREHGRARSRLKWESVAREYAGALNDRYHRHRLAVIRSLIPAKLFAKGRRILDFGCGDAVLLPEFLESGAQIQGIDASRQMVELGQSRLANAGWNKDLVRVGGVNYLRRIKDASLDSILSFNVLAYLDAAEEKTFYQEARRIIKNGGYLVITHSNELFDVFSLNQYTVDFFKKYLIRGASYRKTVAGLIRSRSDTMGTERYSVRENPLAYKYKLARHGFRELRQEFVNLHVAPPPLLKDKSYPNTLTIDKDKKWKLMFVCSTFGSCAIREVDIR